MKKKVSFLIVIIALLLIIALMVAPRKAGASDGIPEGVVRFYDCNQVCYVWPDGSGDCYPCFECEETVVEKDCPKENCSDCEECPACKECKPKCNSGRGNASEGDPDCDPGNSGGHNKGGD